MISPKFIDLFIDLFIKSHTLGQLSLKCLLLQVMPGITTGKDRRCGTEAHEEAKREGLGMADTELSETELTISSQTFPRFWSLGVQFVSSPH